MKAEYGVPAPRGVQKDWKASLVGPAPNAGAMLRARAVPVDWGHPTVCVVWCDRFGRRRVMVGHYANGRSALVRIDANGVSKTTFGDVK